MIQHYDLRAWTIQPVEHVHRHPSLGVDGCQKRTTDLEPCPLSHVSEYGIYSSPLRESRNQELVPGTSTRTRYVDASTHVPLHIEAYEGSDVQIKRAKASKSEYKAYRKHA